MAKGTKVKIAAPQPAGHQPCLVHLYPSGPGLGECHFLGDAPVLIGREAESDIHLDDTAVSRRHARIQPEGDGHVVHDLQSTNGTFVNEVRVQAARLKDGDYLQIGIVIFRYLAGGTLGAAYHEEIYRLTIIDGLTAIHNKRFLMEFLERELARSARHQRALSLLMIDIDHFKSVNDELGHLAGDFALRELAHCIKELLGPEDLFARYGGEEFVVAMSGTLPEAVETAEFIRARVQQHPFRFEDHPIPLTISVGVAATAGDPALTVADFLRQADEKLYQAKNAGRNRVES